MLIVASPPVAQASALDDPATTVAVGPTVTGKARSDSLIPGEWASCSSTGYLRLNTAGIYSIRDKVRCDFGVGWSWDSALTLKAWGGTGGPDNEGCSFSADYVPIEGGVDTDTTLVPVNLHSTAPLDPDCNVTRGSITFWNEGEWTCTGWDAHGSDPDPDTGACEGPTEEFAWSLGALPEPEEDTSPAGCANGNLTGTPRAMMEYLPFPMTRLDGTSTGTPGGKLNYKWTLRIPWAWTSGAPNTSVTKLTYELYWRTPSGIDQKVSQASRTTNQTVNNPNTWQYPIAPPAAEVVQWDGPSTTDAPPGYTLVGFRVRVYDTGAQAGCSWYWGKPIAAYPETAVPLGAIKPPSGGFTEPDVSNPDPDDKPSDGCDGFSFMDPSSWAGAGICVLVKIFKQVVSILKSILDVFGGLASAIVDGLTSAFRALFVPGDGFFDGKVDDVREAWDGTAPGEVVGTFAGLPDKFTAPSDTGCEGPRLRMHVSDALGGEPVDFHPLDACAGWQQRLASITMLCLRLSFYVGAFFVALRVLASSVGVNLGALGGGDDS